MENVDLEKIKDRIAKLLRMSQDASSPNEAAIAAGRARALMDKYQIESFDANNQVKEVFGVEPASGYFKDLPTYMSTLAVAIAKYNDCQAKYEDAEFGQNYGKKRVMFLGYKNDVDLAIAMFDRLLKIIDKLSREYIRGLKDAQRTPCALLSILSMAQQSRSIRGSLL